MKTTTLNFGLNTVKYMVFRDASAVSWGTLPLEITVKNGLIQEPTAAGAKLRSLFASSKLPGERVICSVNGMPFSYRFFTLPRVESAAVPEALTRMARQEMPLSPEEMYLSWRAYPAAGDERQFLVTGISRQPVDALIRMAESAGIRPYLVCLPHISLAALTGRENAIIIDFEPDYSNITLLVHGMPVAMHTVPSLGPGADLPDIAAHLVQELTRMAGFYNNNNPGAPIPETAAILLTGELSADPEVPRIIEEKSGYPVEILRELPANSVVLPPDAPLAAFAVNIGDALQDGIPRGRPAPDPALARPLNLRHIIAERAGAGKRPVPWKMLSLAAVTVIGVGVLALGYLFQHQDGVRVVQLQAELQQAKNDLTRVQAASTRASQTAGTISSLTAATGQLKQQNEIMLNPADSTADLNFLTQCLPTDVTFNTIDVSPAQININGLTSDPDDVVNYVRSLETSGKYQAVNIIWIDRYQGTSDKFNSFLINIIR